jgi:hypothetical protein
MVGLVHKGKPEVSEWKAVFSIPAPSIQHLHFFLSLVSFLELIRVEESDFYIQ